MPTPSSMVVSVAVSLYIGIPVAVYVKKRYSTSTRRDKDRVPFTGRSRYISPFIFKNSNDTTAPGFNLTRPLSQILLYGEAIAKMYNARSLPHSN